MIRLTVPGTLAHRELVLRVAESSCKLARHAVVQEAGHAVGSEHHTAQVVSALGEAFNNIALHAYRVGPAGPVQLSIEVFEDEIVFELEDHGCSHDPSAVRPPDLSALPESGMGLYIIRECMDSVEYVAGSPPDRPNLLRLRKRLGG